MTRFFCVCLLCATCVLSAAEDSIVAIPRLGYVFDSRQRVLKSVEGVPGAAFIGPALDIGFPMADVIVSPDQSFILATGGEDRSAYVLIYSGSAWIQRQIAAAKTPVDSLALSPSGRSAVLYHESDGVVQVIRGLPEAPVVDRELHVPRLHRMAVSDDARLVLVSVRDESSPILAFADDATGRALPVLGPASAMALRPQSHDAVIAAVAGVMLVRESATGSEYQLFSEMTGSCSGLGFSRQGDRFFAAYDDGAIWSYGLAGGGSSSVDCHCVPTLMQQLGSDSVFRLTAGDREPMLVLDGATNRVVWVPMGGQ